MQPSVQSSFLRPTTTIRQHIHLAPRRMNWDFGDVPACPTTAGSPELAAFMMALSYFVVAFEDFGIPVVRQDLPRIQDHRCLAREAQAFISQEALHSQGHAQFNSMMEARHGLDVAVVHREIRRFMRNIAQGTQQSQLAAVAGFEHIIYSLADWYEHARGVHTALHPEVHRLVLWHAMEETEHTAVVYDMYDHIYGRRADAYRVRVAALFRATRITTGTMYRLWRALLPQMVARSGRPAAGFGAWAALVRQALPYAGDYLSYLGRGFSPSDRPVEEGLLPRLRQAMRPRRSDDTQWLSLEVASVREVGADVRAYELVAADGAQLPAWTAGAHVDFEIETGVVRQYSLCGDPADRGRYRIAVKRDVFGRGGSLRLHAEIRRGSRVRIGRPRNHFALQDETSSTGETLLLAGGIGVTPLLAMARTLHCSGRPFALHICARDRAHLAFGAEIPAWPFAAQVHVHLDSEAGPSERVDVATLIPPWDEHRPRALYLCGPAAFMDAAVARATRAGWPASAVHLERFGHTAGPRSGDSAFTLRLQRSGVTLRVDANQTIVEAMEAKGLAPVTSCREGVCGACVCRVVDGAVEHRDAVLTDTEHRDAHRVAICVSRATSESLTLDL